MVSSVILMCAHVTVKLRVKEGIRVANDNAYE